MAAAPRSHRGPLQSNVLNFETNEPQVTPVGPVDQATLYPWPITFTWNPLSGADFTINFTVHTNGITAPDAPTWPEPVGESIFYTRYFPSWGAAQQRGYRWYVSALGPPFGSELTPESESTREEAAPSSERTFFLAGDNTVVEKLYAPSCVEWGSVVNVSWSPVAGATQYQVMFPDALESTEVTYHENNEATLVLDGHYFYSGAAVSVLAFGGSYEGIYGDGFGIPIRPTMPTITAIYPDVDEPDEIDVDWHIDQGYFNEFEIRVYEGSTCSGAVVHTNSLEIAPDVTFGTQYGASLTGFIDGQSYSMRLRASSNPACASPPWSACAPFQFVPPPLPPRRRTSPS